MSALTTAAAALRKALPMPPHVKSRASPYPGGPERFSVSNEKVSWSVSFSKYAPVAYTEKFVKTEPFWADKNAQLSTNKYNQVDGKVSRVSFEGLYEVEPGTFLPLNPRGRTGMTERGLLGRFGPNHAADPVVARFKRSDANGKIVLDANGKQQIEFVAIKRKDNGQWAIPGGMVEPGDTVSLTLKKEFGEEALNTLEMSPEDKTSALSNIATLFAPKNAVVIYRGYVDDPRNTDNAWMETVVMLFFDPTGELTKEIKLSAGDDAGAVKWMTIEPGLNLFASHAEFIELVAERISSTFADVE